MLGLRLENGVGPLEVLRLKVLNVDRDGGPAKGSQWGRGCHVLPGFDGEIEREGGI